MTNLAATWDIRVVLLDCNECVSHKHMHNDLLENASDLPGIYVWSFRAQQQLTDESLDQHIRRTFIITNEMIICAVQSLYDCIE
jgi:hypothetical protein